MTAAGSRPPLLVLGAAAMFEWLREEVGTGPLSGVLCRGDRLVHTVRIGEDGYVPPKDHDYDDGPAQVRPISHRGLAALVQVAYWCHRITADGPVDALFPEVAARTAVNAVHALDNVRPLRGVVHAPVVRRDGSLLTEPGYDDATRLLYLPPAGLDVPPVSDDPTDEEITAARGLLDEMVAGFRFVTDSDRANYYGVLLTPLLRELCPGPYKLAAIGAPQPGSGKTLLATVARVIHGGVFRSELPGDADELRKMISTVLEVTTGPLVHIDNVTGTVRSSVLAGLLTSREWTDRRLGTNEQISARNDRLWMLTGNNVALGGDMVRRTLWITINPGVPDPHLRSGFAIADLEQWVIERRGRLLAALLTLVRAWVAAGQPRERTRGDSYAAWTATVDGILRHSGVAGRFDGRESARQDVGDDDQEWREFLTAVREVFGSTPWTVKELLGRVCESDPSDDEQWVSTRKRPIPLDALPAELVEKVARSRLGLPGIAKSLGMWLRNRESRWAGALAVQSTGQDRSKVALWRVIAADALDA